MAKKTRRLRDKKRAHVSTMVSAYLSPVEKRALIYLAVKRNAPVAQLVRDALITTFGDEMDQLIASIKALPVPFGTYEEPNERNS